jgi:hypothetical protein
MGRLLSLNVRVALASLLAVAAIALGVLELSGRHVRLLQCDRETPQRWLNTGPLRWALLNGLALGCGVTSRIGFWLWYAIPAGAVLFARPDLGAALYGTYSMLRGLAVWGIILGLSRWRGDDTQVWLVGQARTAHVVAAGHLVLLGVAVAIAVGM